MPAAKKLQIILLSTFALILISVSGLSLNQFAYADADCDSEEECAEKIESATKELKKVREKADKVAEKISELSGQLTLTQSEINELESDINSLKNEIDILNQNLENRRIKLSEKIDLRNRVIRNYSKRGVLNDLELFLSYLPSPNLSGFQYATLSYMFEKTLTSETISLIGMINKEISNFESDKKKTEELKTELEDSQKKLVALKNQLAQQKSSQQAVLGDLQEEQKNLEERIEELNEKQQEILAAKSGGGNGTVGDYEAAEQKLPDPGFSPAFAASSYGAYTHRKGMSQYGAKGRAEKGDDYEDIIKFYYKTDVDEKDIPDDICVEGYEEMDFQKYLYGLGEMPSDWPMEALKAQAVAARSYALRYAKQGKCICTTQSCQVFISSKSKNPPSRWKKAVDETKNEVLEDSGIIAYYSSTTGGYIENVGWDTNGSWPGGAYEKKAGSPWFFKAWYTQSYSSDSSTCGLSNPWLDEEEMADILNAWVVWRKGSSSEKDHIFPVTTRCWGGDPYSHEEMAEKAKKYGSKFTSVSSDVDVEISNGGYTSKISFRTNQGKITIDGAEFKTVFNLRAPGYISIRNRLYDFVTE